jgi:glucose-6-phosphate dehydrogenase assembly protein OpcA
MANPLTAAAPAHSSAATLVVVGPADRVSEASRGAAALREMGSFRQVLVSTESCRDPIEAEEGVAVIERLKLEYLNNAIAGIRLSSLPTIIWWRGGPPEELDGVAPLADRVILDADDPAALWQRTPPLFERTALTDLRWARLTRWRAAMAQFFDLPPVRDAAASFDLMRISGEDRAQCALFAGWLTSSVEFAPDLGMDFSGGHQPIESVTLEGPEAKISLELPPKASCLSAEATVRGTPTASRVVAVGDQSLGSLMAQELRVRSRDIAFERALVAALAFLDADDRA